MKVRIPTAHRPSTAAVRARQQRPLGHSANHGPIIYQKVSAPAADGRIEGSECRSEP